MNKVLLNSMNSSFKIETHGTVTHQTENLFLQFPQVRYIL